MKENNNTKIDLIEKFNKKEYKKMAEKASSKSPVIKNIFFAFLIGGLICLFGQLLIEWFLYLKIDKKVSYTLVSVILVFISSLLTGLNIYNKIAKFSGAGTLVPITGFSNAVTAPAIEFKAEGWVLGLAAKMFIIAGPVITYGITASIIYGVFYYIFMTFLNL